MQNVADRQKNVSQASAVGTVGMRLLELENQALRQEHSILLRQFHMTHLHHQGTNPNSACCVCCSCDGPIGGVLQTQLSGWFLDRRCGHNNENKHHNEDTNVSQPTQKKHAVTWKHTMPTGMCCTKGLDSCGSQTKK
jgi:recombinational DNA repair protein (RecF pathway)